MTRNLHAALAAVGVLGVSLVVGSGYHAGHLRGLSEGARAAAEQSSADDQRDQIILNVIVKRNPNATIRDFRDFPRSLVAEATRLGLDYRYVMAIIDKESEWNPRARSSAGAIGLMQVMPSTGALVAKRLNMEWRPPVGNDLGTLGEPVSNIRIGMAHLKGLMSEYGLGPEHLRAYNRGDVAARQHWPNDRYAEDVALRFVRLSMQVPL